MERRRIDLYTKKLREEYKNCMSAYFRMMSYYGKLENVEELTDKDRAEIELVHSRALEWSERFYKRFHSEK